MLGTLAILLNSPLSEIRLLTLGQIVRYMRVMPDLLPLTNPFAGEADKKDEPLKGNAAVMALSAMGISQKKEHDG